MTLCIRMLLAAVIVAFAQLGTCYGADTVRVAVQKTGTLAWELAVIRAHGLDKQADLSVQVIELASPEAGKIALRAGNADIIVSDWLWVSRERTLGAKLDILSLFERARRRDGTGLVPDPDIGRSQRPQARRRRRPDRQELAAAAGVAETGRHRPEVGRDDRLRRATAADGQDAWRRNGCDPELLEFLRRAGSKGLSPRRRHRGSAAETRGRGAAPR